MDCLVEIKMKLARWRLPDVVADPIDDIRGAVGIPDDAVESFPDLAQIRRLLLQKIHGRAGVVARSGDRLLDFMRQGSRQLSHHAQAVHVREIRLQLAQPLTFVLRAFAVPSHR